MNTLKADPGRREILRSVTIREKAMLNAWLNKLASDTTLSNDLRKQILSLQRKADSAGGKDLAKRIEALTENKRSVDLRIESSEQNREISRERYGAALRLYRSCEAHISEQGAGQ